MTGLLLIGAFLLIGAGVAKTIRPHDTARALRRAGLPVGRGAAAVRAGAVFEVAVGLAAIVVAGPVPAIAVALSYGAFALFLALALGRGWSLSSCGCFGEPDTPPTALHLVLDAVLGAGAALAASGPSRSPLAQVLSRPVWGADLVALSAVAAGLVYLVMARLPQLKAVPT